MAIALIMIPIFIALYGIDHYLKKQLKHMGYTGFALPFAMVVVMFFVANSIDLSFLQTSIVGGFGILIGLTFNATKSEDKPLETDAHSALETSVVDQTVKIVFSSDRGMPAHFTSDDDRTQTFLVDFDQLSSEDEYNMASTAYNIVGHFIEKIDSPLEYGVIAKFGEDLMLGGYVFTKLDGDTEDQEKLYRLLIETNEEKLLTTQSDIDVQNILSNEGVRDYLFYCFKGGVELARTGDLSMPKGFF